MGWKGIPSTPGQTDARNFILDLALRKWNYPQQKVVGLGDTEKAAMAKLNEYIRSPAATWPGATLPELEKTVSGGYDPMKSPYYAGYRQASKLEEDEAIGALNRRLQLAGHGGFSTPGLSAEGKTRRGFAADRMMALGQLHESERNRQITAAPMFAELSEYAGTEPVRRAQTATTVGAVPRTLEQAQEQAIYEALVNTLLGPYLRQAPLAQGIIGEPRYAHQQDNDMDWLSLAGMLGMGAAMPHLAGGISGMFAGPASSFSNPMAVYGAPAGF